jgi:hypothetical protein
MSMGRTRLREVLQNGPMTARELTQGPHKISKDVITRALNAGEISHDAVVWDKSRKRYVALYYLDERQLELRHDLDIFVRRYQIEETEQTAIAEYVKKHLKVGHVRVGNAERELGLSFCLESNLCTVRRDTLLRIAKERGVEVLEGYDENIPSIGSKRWWSNHTKELTGTLEKTLEGLPVANHIPRGSTLSESSSPLSPSSMYRNLKTLEVGCELGTISFPKYVRHTSGDRMKQLLRATAIQHPGEAFRERLGVLLGEAIAHCDKALEATEKAWKDLEIVAESSSEVLLPDMKTDLIMTAYYMLVQAVEGVKSRPIHLELDGKLADELNKKIADQTAQNLVRQSIDEMQVSDKHFGEFKTLLKELVRTWSTKGLVGSCDICRDVTPRPENITLA